MTKKISPEDLAKIREVLKRRNTIIKELSELTLAKIGEKFGLSYQKVWRYSMEDDEILDHAEEIGLKKDDTSSSIRSAVRTSKTYSKY